uniref:Uncharacterized protein n=1 Tax=Arundo donax TaxID=35708 RepID=A0A0A9B0B3_ARUDO
MESSQMPLPSRWMETRTSVEEFWSFSCHHVMLCFPGKGDYLAHSKH